MRAVVLLLSLVLGGQVVDRIADGTSECRDQCTDDDEDGRCPPTCVDCTCCVHTTPTVSLPMQLSVPFTARAPLVIEEKVTPLSADPRDILHVPRSILA